MTDIKQLKAEFAGRKIKSMHIYDILSSLEPCSEEQGIMLNIVNDIVLNYDRLLEYDTIIFFINEKGFSYFVNKPIYILYDEYIDYCKSKKFDTKGRKTFTRKVSSTLHLVDKVGKLDGKATRFFRLPYELDK